MPELNTAWLLRQWALWSYENNGVIGRVGCTLAPLVPVDYRDKEYFERSIIADDLALRVDALMAELKLFDADYFLILATANRFTDWGWRKIANHCGVGRCYAARVYEDAYTWFDERIEKEFLRVA